MCGRFTRRYTWSEVAWFLRLPDGVPASNIAASHNVAPTQSSVICWYDAVSGRRTAGTARWGLIPGWATDPRLGSRAFNCRGETIADKAMFRAAFQARRCIVPVSEFYEWRKPDKRPFAIGMADGGIMALAGLFERWKSPEGEVVQSFTIVTTGSNALMAELHDRMPVLLAPEAWSAWLGEHRAAPSELRALIKPSAAEIMRIWPVGARIGTVGNDDPGLIETAKPADDLLLL